MLTEVEKEIVDPHPNSDQHQDFTTSRGHPFSTPNVFGRRQ